jgi:hypothetical protein
MRIEASASKQINLQTVRSRGQVLLFAAMSVASLVHGPAPADAELSFQPVLPQFGGNNGQSLSVLQYERQLKDAEKAEKEARARELERLARAKENASTPASRLVDTLTNQLQFQLAQGFADEILNGGVSGTFDLGGTLLEYTRIDGILAVIITEPGKDSVTIELPVAN